MRDRQQHGAARSAAIRRRAIRCAAIFFATAALGAVPGAARAGVSVVTTTPDYAAIVSAILGGRVASLARPTEDPHFVDARPSHIVKLNRADLLIESGASLEIGWLRPLVEGARNTKIQRGAPGRLEASRGIEMKEVPAVLDRSQGDVHAEGNPHFLTDPENARIFARSATAALCRIDAGGCPTYQANLATFDRALVAKLEVWKTALAPFRGTAIVTYHNTWRYFMDRFGLHADLFLEPKPGIPPSPPHLAKVIAEMKRERIGVILVEPYQSRKTAEVVASHAGAQVVDVCQYPGGLPDTDHDYIALMDHDVGALAAALVAAAAD